ncbi:MAG: 8-amino-7-oxononanoate synthase [Ectothiorhodospiraceae bacterium]|nr:8-amino-7-oxononanoate synthase [Ectothiorhodospiraceae bacterium]MCH8504624.1 8-amino-7-oxononanoate synthase [Ectothiorhodospiraceae bacterium]
MWDIASELEALRDAGLWRQTRPLEPTGPVTATCRGRELLVFCSNDYLGLSGHPAIREAFRQGVDTYGVGSGAAHLITGHRPVHDVLEQELATWLGRDRSLLFSTGYMANVGTIASLMMPEDLVLQDRLNHASLLDGGWLCRAPFERYPHGDLETLGEQLQRPARRKLVVTDGLFSMDGDIAPLPELAALCAGHGAALMVDDAHGIGVMGPGGRGSVAAAGLSQEQVPLLVGTLGKAFGTFGAFVAGPEAWIEWLLQRARTFVFTTAPPPAVASATLASLRLVQAEDWRRRHLEALVAQFRHGALSLGLQLMPSQTPIQPIILGDAARAVDASQALERRGFLVTAIRPPTVPQGSARLRVTLCAEHDETQVDRLLSALEDVLC